MLTTCVCLRHQPVDLLIDACSKYGNKHDILYNHIKSKCVIFLPKRYKLTVPTVSLDGNKLDYEDHIKYLGVVLSSDCKDDNDIL